MYRSMGSLKGLGAVNIQLYNNSYNATTTANPSAFEVGHAFSLLITGATPGQPVSMTGSFNGKSLNASYVIDQGGRLQINGVMGSDVLGDWSETWSVGGVSRTFNFKVVPAGGMKQNVTVSSAPATIPGTNKPVYANQWPPLIQPLPANTYPTCTPGRFSNIAPPAGCDTSWASDYAMINGAIDKLSNWKTPPSNAVMVAYASDGQPYGLPVPKTPSVSSTPSSTSTQTTVPVTTTSQTSQSSNTGVSSNTISSATIDWKSLLTQGENIAVTPGPMNVAWWVWAAGAVGVYLLFKKKGR